MRKQLTEKNRGVLIISPFFRPNIGGVETHLDDLCEFLRTHGYSVFVITYQPLTTKTSGLIIERKENLKIHRISWPAHNLFHKLEPYPILEWMYLFPVLFLSGTLFLFKRRQDIQVIHAHGFVGAFITKLLSRIFRIRSVASTHAIYSLQKRTRMAIMIRFLLRSFDRILTLSYQSKNELCDIGIEQPQKIAVYTYWIDQTLFIPQNKLQAKKQCGWENKFIVLFVGRLIKIKGVQLLIDAASAVNKEISFAIIGDGPLEAEVSRASRDLKNIIFLGKIENNHLVQFYNAADCVIVPSQYEEGFGRVILEALSCGTPVLASRRGGIPEVIDESVG